MGIVQHNGLAVCALALSLAGCGSPGPPADFQPGEHGRVVRVIDGDALVLDTGQSVRLVGIEAPSFGREGRPDAPHAAESRRMLEDMVLGREVQLHYAGLTRDRYDRALAHVMATDRLGPKLWINRELVARGAVRVRTHPDTARGSDLLFRAEADARASAVGLWALNAYAVEDARDLDVAATGFLVLTGILGPRRPPLYEDNSCTRPLLGSEITLVVELAAMEACDLESGLRVRVRGWYRDGRLRLNAAPNLEELNAAAMAANSPTR